MNVVMLGRISHAETPSGPIVAAQHLFAAYPLDPGDTLSFVEYYFDGARHSLIKKLLGSERRTEGTHAIHRLGIFRIPARLWEMRPDIIAIMNFERFAIVAVLYALVARIPVFYLVHGIIRHERKQYQRDGSPLLSAKDAFCEWCFLRAAHTIGVFSIASRDLACAHFPSVVSRPWTLIDHGIADCFFEHYHPQGDVSMRPMRIVFNGDIDRPEKGWSFVRSALEGIGLPFEVVALCERRKGETEWIHPGVRVSYIGAVPQEQLPAVYEDANIFLCASMFETFSLATAEAMAMGLIPIVTRSSGIARFIMDGKNGFLITHGDDKALIDILARLHHDRPLCVLCGTAAHSTVSHLRWSIVAGEYARLFHQLASQRPATPP